MPSVLRASASAAGRHNNHQHQRQQHPAQPHQVKKHHREQQHSLVSDWHRRLRRWRQFDADSQSTLAECFDAAYVSRMTVPDAEPGLPSKRPLRVTDPWRHEWQRGVQVPIDSDRLEPTVRLLSPGDNPLSSEAATAPAGKPASWRLPARQLLRTEPASEDLPAAIRDGSTVGYCSDELDARWMRLTGVSPDHLEAVITAAEVATHARLQASLRGTAGLGIEFDSSVACSACLCPEAGPDNEIVFCDGCDAAVHQACYGLTDVPEGTWLCQPCSRGLRRRPDCLLCPANDASSSSSAASFGHVIAMKSAGCDPDSWCHLACALWLPEVTFGDVDAVTEPLQDFEAEVPPWRRALLCRICRQRGVGACVQCGVRRCNAAFHVGCLATSCGSVGVAGSGGRLASVEGRDGRRKYLVYCDRHADTAEAAKAMGRERQWRRRREQLMKLKRKLKQLKGKPPVQLALALQRETLGRNRTGPDNGLLNKRNMKLKELEANFHTAVSPGDLQRSLGSRKIDAKTVSLVLDYWKLKRTAGGCRPMLTTSVADCSDPSGHLCQQLHLPLAQQAVASAAASATSAADCGYQSSSPAVSIEGPGGGGGAEDAKLVQQGRTLVRLRLDLERVRNLCYLVLRREKTKRSLLHTCQRIGECQLGCQFGKQKGAAAASSSPSTPPMPAGSRPPQVDGNNNSDKRRGHSCRASAVKSVRRNGQPRANSATHAAVPAASKRQQKLTTPRRQRPRPR
ncbi:hypothetical protein BOX15_Mlig019500g1 [Macrostomum lignano]|uniref:PHD-type domain-containing protein n=2 Tax=Macrostomum lignano TaxID=282301 RepID=A0A267ETW3_9PLAT|nr:hypothetical protein BOX15_Mlig019500g1 [Macrostomum lignano]